jgi:hypothetical protein
MNAIETIEYGEVINSCLIKIFGDEMTYNELKFYAENIDGTTFLKVETNRNTETQLVRVWFDNQVVMDKKYSIHHSCDMFYLLSEIEPEPDTNTCETCNLPFYDMLMFYKKGTFCICENEDECCNGKNCDEKKGLNMGMGWNRYYSTKDDMLTEQMFCGNCYDNYVYSNCKSCGEKYPYTEMEYKNGGAFGKATYEYTNYFCEDCVNNINSVDYDPAEYR